MSSLVYRLFCRDCFSKTTTVKTRARFWMRDDFLTRNFALKNLILCSTNVWIQTNVTWRTRKILAVNKILQIQEIYGVMRTKFDLYLLIILSFNLMTNCVILCLCTNATVTRIFYHGFDVLIFELLFSP